MQCGLLRSSFVPPAEVRQWRHLTRQRVKLIDQRTGVINRIHSVLEQGNIKLSNVASNIMGVSGRAMIKAMSNGESDPAKLAALSQGRLKADFEQLVEALDGQLNENQRWLLKRLLGQVKTLEDEVAIYSERIAEQMRPYKTQLERLDTIGGIGQRSAENLLAEIGPDMSPFPTDDQLVSWGGLCPGKNQSGGKNRSGKTPQGNKWPGAHLNRSGVGRETQERQLSGCALSSAGAAPRQKTGDYRGGADDLAVGLARAEGGSRLQGIGR
jgi:hypothetical protein